MRAIALAIIIAGVGIRYAMMGKTEDHLTESDKIIRMWVTLGFLVCLAMGW